MNGKPPSIPYVSGDGFRSLCHHFFEAGNSARFDPASVHDGDLVFCEASRLPEFLAGPAGRVRKSFSIVSHNGDLNVDQAVVDALPPTVRLLFAQNSTVSEKRVVPLPIGLENRRLHYNGVPRDFNRLRRRMPPKKPRILSAFTIGTNKAVRQAAADALAGSAASDFLSRTNSREYRKIAAGYMFVASPPGNGADCHRTWEAMYLRSVPIVLRSPLAESFLKLGLPLLIVDSYTEAAALTEEDLLDIYADMSPRMESKALWFDFWAELITAKTSWEN